MVRLVLALTLTMGSSAPRQNTPAEADSPAAIAWIAYGAVEAGDRSRLSQLEAALGRLVDDPRREAQLAVGAILDALVRLDVKPALHLLSHTIDTHPVETLLLLKRFGPERGQVALEALKQSTTGDPWFSLANLLIETPTPGFACALLDGLPVNIVVWVAESRSPGGLGVGGGLGNCSALSLADGFPPLASYRFTGPTQGQPLIAGIRPTFYWRYPPLGAGVSPSRCGSYNNFPTADERLKYVGVLLGDEILPEAAGGVSRSEVWGGSTPLLEAVERYRGEVNDGFDRLLRLLEARGLLTADERQALRPQIKVRLVDLRQDKSGPLPTIK